jgi:hypothetical protein
MWLNTLSATFKAQSRSGSGDQLFACFCFFATSDLQSFVNDLINGIASNDAPRNNDWLEVYRCRVQSLRLRTGRFIRESRRKAEQETQRLE